MCVCLFLVFEFFLFGVPKFVGLVSVFRVPMSSLVSLYGCIGLGSVLHISMVSLVSRFHGRINWSRFDVPCCSVSPQWTSIQWMDKFLHHFATMVETIAVESSETRVSQVVWKRTVGDDWVFLIQTYLGLPFFGGFPTMVLVLLVSLSNHPKKTAPQKTDSSVYLKRDTHNQNPKSSSP